MKGFFTTDDELNKNNRLEEKRKQFAVEFNRYYFTKQYEKAFDLCINNMADEENRNFVYAKAQLAIEKLTNRIELSDKSRIDQDWVIDTLVNYGHKNLKVNGDEIKVETSKIYVTIGNKVEIKVKSIISIFTFILLVFIVGFISYYFAEFVWDEIFRTYEDGIMYIIFTTLMMYLIKFQLKHRLYVRYIAASILDKYNNL